MILMTPISTLECNSTKLNENDEQQMWHRMSCNQNASIKNETIWTSPISQNRLFQWLKHQNHQGEASSTNLIKDDGWRMWQHMYLVWIDSLIDKVIKPLSDHKTKLVNVSKALNISNMASHDLFNHIWWNWWSTNVMHVNWVESVLIAIKITWISSIYKNRLHWCI